MLLMGDVALRNGLWGSRAGASLEISEEKLQGDWVENEATASGGLGHINGRACGLEAWAHVRQMVVYGLGSVEESRASRYQVGSWEDLIVAVY